MHISAFDYELPPELIAQQPLAERDASRMLVLDRANRSWTDSSFKNFTEHLRSDDVVVVNNSRVIPARLKGRREETGGQVEIFLVRELEAKVWDALVKPGGRLKAGSRVVFDERRRLKAEMLDGPGAELRRVRFYCEGSFERLLGEIGVAPLPPYIKRIDPQDGERYQTIYAKERGAIAAPTAGLHFTPAILAALDAAGVERAAVTLHVGYGTFKPVRVEDVEAHVVDPERYTIAADVAARLNAARAAGRRIVAVGTTTVRALESAGRGGPIAAGDGVADVFIYPGGTPIAHVDALLTNFHLPRSSLLMLVCAFAGREAVLRAYHEAVAAGYRFYSYGDAMLIV
jgi:S-adenosylmethionine:tRNA ribosyltransferase-isomerase